MVDNEEHPSVNEALRFVGKDELSKFLRTGRYVPEIGAFRRVFQRNGIFVNSADRYVLTEFLPGLFLGPSTLDRLRGLIPRVRNISVSGIALRSQQPGIPMSLQHFLRVMSEHQGETLNTDDYLFLGPVTERPASGEHRLAGRITYEWSLRSSNPFEPFKASLEYEARQVDSFIDVYVVSDRDRDLFKLSDALDYVGRNYGDWEVVRVNRDRYPSTASRHQILREVTNQLNVQRSFISLGVARYGAGRADDAPAQNIQEFDRSHHSREGEVSFYNLDSVMTNLVQRGSYMTKADMVFMYRNEEHAYNLARVETYIKLRHRRLDISLVDTRELGSTPHASISTLDAYQQLTQLQVSPRQETAMLRDLWVAISPAIFGPLVAWRPSHRQEMPTPPISTPQQARRTRRKEMAQAEAQARPASVASQ